MTVDLVVIGAGGFGRETLDVVEAHNRSERGGSFNLLGVVDDAPSDLNLERLKRRGIPFLGRVETLLTNFQQAQYLIGVGNPQVRAKLAELCEERGFSAAMVVHPSASIGSDVVVDPGTVICGGVQVSTNVALGHHVHLNPGAIIGHDSNLSDFVSVNPGAVVSGDVHIGQMVLVGASATVLQGLSIGESSVVGANACVTKNVAYNQTVIGTPARILMEGQ